MKAAILVLVLAGCSSFVEKQAASSTYRILVRSNAAAGRQSDVELARAALPGGIVQLETFALAYPSHRGFKELYADALCTYATAFVFDDWEDADLAGRAGEAERIAHRLRGLLDQCVDANLRLLPANWQRARSDAGAWQARLRTASASDARWLLGVATADAVRIAVAPIESLASVAPTLATLHRCIELAPGAHDASGELLLATLEAGMHRFTGGPDGSELFARARRLRGDGALIIDVMAARALGDRAQFERALRAVIDADLARWPEQRLANELARIKARRYLAAIDRLIPP